MVELPDDEQGDVYELRERGVRVLGGEQCCELACDGGACESCPCCCAGWCVWGHSGEIPTRDLAPQSDYRIWLDEAADHNPVAKLLAQIEGVAEVDYDEPPQPRPDVAEAVAGERQRIKTGLLEEFHEDHPVTERDHGYNAGIQQAIWVMESGFATGSVPVATPQKPHADYCGLAAHSTSTVSGCPCWCHTDPVATPQVLCGEISAVKGWAPCDREIGHGEPHTWPLIPPPVPGDQT